MQQRVLQPNNVHLNLKALFGTIGGILTVEAVMPEKGPTLRLNMDNLINEEQYNSELSRFPKESVQHILFGEDPRFRNIEGNITTSRKEINHHRIQLSID